jgi:ABC-2 type transport system permease protein
VLLTAIVFSLGGLFNAIFAKNFDQISWFPTFILTPMIYFGGVFYSVSLLPGWAESLSYVNPILYMVNAFRHGFLGTSDVNLGFAFAIMAAFAVAMFAVVVVLMNRGTGIRE